MTTSVSLCQSCQHSEVVVEVLKHKVVEYKSCDYWHQWYNKITKPAQCRDYTPLEDGEKS
jgi:hypothetical protein